MCQVIFSVGLPGTRWSIRLRKGVKNMQARTTVAMLKSTWTKAVRLAFALEFIAAMMASIVEPMLLPITSAAANSQFTRWL